MAERDNEASSASVHGEEQGRQRQPEGLDRLANLMAQYIEQQQRARPERSTTVHEQFMKLKPPEFVGTTNPLVAEEWLKRLGAIFEVMGVSDEQRVALATFMLRGEARNWWESMRRMRTVQTWQQFVDMFNEQYFPMVYRYQMEQDFISLKQEKLSVTEYEEQFTSLSRFAPELVATEGAKCRRFQQGLKLKIRSKLSALELMRYAELVNKAKIVERDVTERSGKREEVKKRKVAKTGASQSKSSGAVALEDVDQMQVSAELEGVGSGSSRGAGSSGGLVCYRCGVEGHMIRDCPLPWSDTCYQCGQPGHMARDCIQESTTTVLADSGSGGSRRGGSRRSKSGINFSEFRDEIPKVGRVVRPGSHNSFIH